MGKTVRSTPQSAPLWNRSGAGSPLQYFPDRAAWGVILNGGALYWGRAGIDSLRVLPQTWKGVKYGVDRKQMGIV